MNYSNIRHTICIGLAILVCLSLLFGCGKKVYVARTTLMETRKPGIKCTASSINTRCATMSCIAMEKKNLQRTSATLGGLGVKITADDLSKYVMVHPVVNTNIISIESTFDDPHVARVVTDIMASETKVECQKKLKADIRTIDPTYIIQRRTLF